MIYPGRKALLPDRHALPGRLAGPAMAALVALAMPAMAMPVGGPEGAPSHGPQMMHPAPISTVTVNGSGQAAATPDLATVQLGVQVQAATAAEAMTQNAAIQQAVISAVKDSGVEARDIQTSGLGLNAVQEYPGDGKPPVVTGYQARNIVTVRVRDLTALGALLDKVTAAGANEIQGIIFSREDTLEAESTARKQAVENARSHAEAIANAAGLRLGQLLSVRDGGAMMPPQPVMMRAMAQSDRASIPVEAGELTVTADVTAVWQMVSAQIDDEAATGAAAPGQGAEQSGAAEPADTSAMPEAGSIE